MPLQTTAAAVVTSLRCSACSRSRSSSSSSAAGMSLSLTTGSVRRLRYCTRDRVRKALSDAGLDPSHVPGVAGPSDLIPGTYEVR